MGIRVRYTRKHSWNTRSNQIRTVKTPGGRVVVQYMKKQSSHPVDPVTRQPLQGVKTRRPKAMRLLKKRFRSVSRPYGGSISGGQVRDRIVRAFMNGEIKIVKVATEQQARANKAKAKK